MPVGALALLFVPWKQQQQQPEHAPLACMLLLLLRSQQQLGMHWHTQFRPTPLFCVAQCLPQVLQLAALA